MSPSTSRQEIWIFFDVMKKLLMMATLGAMALGAQADSIDYTYGLTLYDVPLASMDNVKSIKCYLVDSSVKDSSVSYGTKGSVMAEFSYSGMAKDGVQVQTVQYDTKSYNVSGVQTSSAQKYAVDARKADGYIGQVTFETETITWNDMGKYQEDVDKYAQDNLKAYLVVTTSEEGDKLVEHEFSIKVTANASNVALGSSATYQQVIPEPTSGMFVFLGLAGLMLKRKRAA